MKKQWRIQHFMASVGTTSVVLHVRLKSYLHIQGMASAVLLTAALSTGIAQAEVLDDPMRPPGYARSTGGGNVKPAWHLSAIRIDGDQRIAIINGRMLEVGEWVNNARLIEILPERVRLNGRQGAFSIKLVKVQVRKSPVLQAGK